MSAYVKNYERVLAESGQTIGDRVYFHCPFPGCAGYTKRKFHVDPATGGWNCWHCHQPAPERIYREDAISPSGGSWRDFALMMADDLALWPVGPLPAGALVARPKLPLKQARQLWVRLLELSPLTPEAADAMEARGIDPFAARMGLVQPEGFARLLEELGEENLVLGGLMYRTDAGEARRRSCVQDGRTLIPYPDEKEGVLHFVGYRQPPEKQSWQSETEYQVLVGNWAKYSGPAGYSSPPFGRLPQPSFYAVVTEGHLKQLAGAQAGLPILGLQGMGSGHAAVAKECQKARVERAFLLFDTSLEDQDQVDYEEERLARELIRRGIRPYRCRLPFHPDVEGGKKMDIDAFLLQFGTGPLLEQLEAACHQPYLLSPAPSDEVSSEAAGE